MHTLSSDSFVLQPSLIAETTPAKSPAFDDFHNRPALEGAWFTIDAVGYSPPWLHVAQKVNGTLFAEIRDDAGIPSIKLTERRCRLGICGGIPKYSFNRNALSFQKHWQVP